MFVTDALRRRVQSKIDAMRPRVDWLEALAQRQEPWHLDPTTCWAAERALHVSVELVTDIADAVIDALVMREAGSYEDMLHVLEEEHVVTKAWLITFQGVLTARTQLVRAYADVQPEDVRAAVVSYAWQFRPYCDAISSYLQLSK